MPETKKIEEVTQPAALERRVMAIDDIELRVTDDESPKITGYAAKFNKWSLDLGGFREKIQKGAFDEAVDKSDVRALKNHDPNLLLGRTSSGTLRLNTNARGLGFEIDPPDTATGRDTVTEIRRKDITGCSFSFTTAEDDWKYLEDGRVERTIIKVDELFDVGPVTYPAYPDTTVAARSMERVLAEHKTQDEPDEPRAGSPVKIDLPTPVENEQENREEPEERTEPEKTKEEIEAEEKTKRQKRLDIQRKVREADCIHKRVVDQINEIKSQRLSKD